MAAVEVTISGVLYDKLGRTTQSVVLIGEATMTGLSVGGGPVIPPSRPGGMPPTWGGSPGGDWPEVWPPGFWGHPDIDPPKPQPMPPEPPNPGTGKPPPPEGGWGWSPDYGWGYFPMGGGKPQPGRK